MKRKVGVLLSGCGFKDDSEIHESVCTLLALDRLAPASLSPRSAMYWSSRRASRAARFATSRVPTPTRSTL